eukprot:297438-Pelagomonas_calceolata.AAC.3
MAWHGGPLAQSLKVHPYSNRAKGWHGLTGCIFSPAPPIGLKKGEQGVACIQGLGHTDGQGCGVSIRSRKPPGLAGLDFRLLTKVTASGVEFVNSCPWTCKDLMLEIWQHMYTDAALDRLVGGVVFVLVERPERDAAQRKRERGVWPCVKYAGWYLCLNSSVEEGSGEERSGLMPYAQGAEGTYETYALT